MSAWAKPSTPRAVAAEPSRTWITTSPVVHYLPTLASGMPQITEGLPPGTSESLALAGAFALENGARPEQVAPHTIPERRSIQRIRKMAITPKMIRWGREKFGISGLAI